MESYLGRIRAILDQASGDATLSTEAYIELCEAVAQDAQSRADASNTDLQRESEQ